MAARAAEATSDLDLPRVQGRHRNRVLAAQRRDRAVQLATAGYTYQRIADEMGYANRGTVHRIVQQALQRKEATDVEFLRTVTLARLDALLDAVWDRVEAGEVRAALAALRIELLRCRLLGLFADGATSGRRPGFGACEKPNTVVVHPECRASNCLDHAAEHR